MKPASTSQAGGTAWASFLLGYPDYTVDAQSQAYGIREAYLAPYIQDDWRVTRKLTLNMGLRWDINLPYTELQGREATYNPNLPNPDATGLTGAVAFYGTGPGRLGPILLAALSGTMSARVSGWHIRSTTRRCSAHSSA